MDTELVAEMIKRLDTPTGRRVFIPTGSRVYGAATAASDYDFVVDTRAIPNDLLAPLLELCGAVETTAEVPTPVDGQAELEAVRQHYEGGDCHYIISGDNKQVINLIVPPPANVEDWRWATVTMALLQRDDNGIPRQFPDLVLRDKNVRLTVFKVLLWLHREPSLLPVVINKPANWPKTDQPCNRRGRT
jgi:hypothetical protein